jgi:hypothetical protein
MESLRNIEGIVAPRWASVKPEELASELKRYEENALELVMPNGRSAEVWRHGVQLPLDFFASQAAERFAGSVRAQHEASLYRALRIGGIAGIVGGALIAGGAIAATVLVQGPGRLPLAYALWSTSTTAIVGGSGALVIAPLYLSRAVAYYNEDMVAQW